MSPVIKNLLKVFQSWLDSLAEKKILDVNNSSVVSIERFINLSKRYKETTDKVSEFYKNETTIKNENELYKIDLEDIKNQLNHLKSENESLEKGYKNVENEKRILKEQLNSENEKYDVSYLNGSWTNTYKSNEHNLSGSEIVIIENGKYSILDNRGKKNHIFNIIAFHKKSEKEIFFIKERIKMDKGYKLNGILPPELRYNANVLVVDNKGTLSGLENLIYAVEYRRT